jgi:hypothetical protein
MTGDINVLTSSHPSFATDLLPAAKNSIRKITPPNTDVNPLLHPHLSLLAQVPFQRPYKILSQRFGA